MRHQCALLALIAVQVTDCCDPPSMDYGIDKVLTEADVREIIDRTILESRSEIKCADACHFAVQEQLPGWQTGEPAECTLNLDGEPSMSLGEEVGWVKCEGTAVEYDCD